MLTHTNAAFFDLQTTWTRRSVIYLWAVLPFPPFQPSLSSSTPVLTGNLWCCGCRCRGGDYRLRLCWWGCKVCGLLLIIICNCKGSRCCVWKDQHDQCMGIFLWTLKSFIKRRTVWKSYEQIFAEMQNLCIKTKIRLYNHCRFGWFNCLFKWT